jgi:predicted PurR-regulated permease PerM
LSTAKAIGIVAGIALALALLALIAQILLLVFAGILLAIVLRSIANGIDAVLGIGKGWSLTLALSAVVLTVAMGSCRTLSPKASNSPINCRADGMRCAGGSAGFLVTWA